MIFRNFFNKVKKQTKPKKMNLGVRIVELARELNCIYVNENYYLENTSGVIYSVIYLLFQHNHCGVIL